MSHIADMHRYFMQLACQVATESKSPLTQVGVIIVSRLGYTISSSYNSQLDGIPDSDHTWHDDNRYDTVIHAEMKAIVQAKSAVKGGSIYTTLFPSKESAKLIIASGIRHVYYKQLRQTEDFYLIKELFEQCNVSVRRIEV